MVSILRRSELLHYANTSSSEIEANLDGDALLPILEPVIDIESGIERAFQGVLALHSG